MEQLQEFALADGRYKAGFAMPDPMPALGDIPEYAIRCANAIPFENGINDLEICVEI